MTSIYIQVMNKLQGKDYIFKCGMYFKRQQSADEYKLEMTSITISHSQYGTSLSTIYLLYKSFFYKQNN